MIFGVFQPSDGVVYQRQSCNQPQLELVCMPLQQLEMREETGSARAYYQQAQAASGTVEQTAISHVAAMGFPTSLVCCGALHHC